MAGNRCLNCGQSLAGRYCSQCGQDARQNKRPLAAFGYDFFETTLQYDSKFWRTIVPFALRPGHLTNEFNLGRRVRYLHPRKMYFFVSIVFFLLFTLFEDARFLDFHRDRSDLMKAATEMATTAGGVSGTVESSIQSATGQRPTLRYRIAQRLEHLKRMDQNLMRERFSRSVASNLPKMLFLLLPFFALLAMLLFRRGHKYYVEHLVYAFHAHTYIFTIAALCLVYEQVTHDTKHATFGLALIVPYVFLSTRSVYQESWLTTLWKFVVLVVLYAVVVALGLTLLVATTFWFL